MYAAQQRRQTLSCEQNKAMSDTSQGFAGFALIAFVGAVLYSLALECVTRGISISILFPYHPLGFRRWNQRLRRYAFARPTIASLILWVSGTPFAATWLLTGVQVASARRGIGRSRRDTAHTRIFRCAPTCRLQSPRKAAKPTQSQGRRSTKALLQHVIAEYLPSLHCFIHVSTGVRRDRDLHAEIVRVRSVVCVRHVFC
jgi:hypothetical protein